MRDITLGIESSCDETSASIVENGRHVLSNVIASQISIHTQYGGVVPEIASRKHVEAILPVIHEAFIKADVKKEDISRIAVTFGPGLRGALLIGVHHIEGHISANYIQYTDLTPPFLCLVVSGGHSHIIDCVDYGEFHILARTRDDAAGEAFDKVSRSLGLGYPGGPAVDKAARLGDKDAIKFPRTHFTGSLDFSFSGLKTAVLNYLSNSKDRGEEINVNDVCASFQYAVVDILTQNLIKASELTGRRKIALAGGVASNSQLREAVRQACEDNKASFYCPSPILCTDNSAMIACAGYYAALKGRKSSINIDANANMDIERIGDYII